MQFTKSHLYYDDYSDTATSGDNPEKIKEDIPYLNKSESYEMVKFINTFLDRYEKEKTIDNFQKVEKMSRHADFNHHRLKYTYGRSINEKWDDKKYKSL